MNWSDISLAVFDVDGTLYDQRALRRRMLLQLLGDAMASRSLTTLRVLRAYRHLREQLGDDEVENFEPVLVSRTSEKTGIGKETVESIVARWMEQRPLAHLASCCYPGLAELFAALRRHGKKIGILSDYPAEDKLRALGLSADFVVAAGDASVRILKPHPRGLEVLMKLAGATPGETLLIGDRVERDGEAARRAGAFSLIRSSRPVEGWTCFEKYSDPVFAALLAPGGA